MRSPRLALLATVAALGVLAGCSGSGTVRPARPERSVERELAVREGLHEALSGDEAASARGRDRVIAAGTDAVPFLLEALRADEALASARPADALRGERLRHRKLAFLLGEIRDPRAVPSLLEHYDGPTFGRALEKITGQGLGDDLPAWREWYVAQPPASPEAMANAVRQFKSQGASERLQAVRNLTQGVRARTGAAMLEAKPEALDPGARRQIQLMTAEDLERCRAARSLLQAAFEDPEQLVRYQAQLLAIQLGPMAVDPLRPLARASTPSTRRAALQTLGEIADIRALPELAAALAEPDLSPLAAWALGRIGDPQALPLLREALGRQGHVKGRASVLAALVQCGDLDRFETLLDLLAQGGEARDSAADQLGLICKRTFEILFQERTGINLPPSQDAWEEYRQSLDLGKDPGRWRAWWTLPDSTPRELFRKGETR